MANNIGKRFEADFKKSVPPYALLYRLPDSAQAFGGSGNLRFSRKNPFDFLLWDSNSHILFALEMKTVGSKFISFEREKNEKGIIHYHQIKGLNEWNKYDGIICGFIIEFRKLEKTIFLEIQQFNKLVNSIEKKSFTLNDLENNQINYYTITQKKLRTRYTYDLNSFLLEIQETALIKK